MVSCSSWGSRSRKEPSQGSCQKTGSLPLNPGARSSTITSGSSSRSISSRTHHDAHSNKELYQQITITDPQHPLYGRTFPLVGTCSSRSDSRLILALPNGYQRIVPRSVTNIDRPSAEQLPLPL